MSRPPSPLKDELGNRYGMLNVIAMAESQDDGRARAYWICECDCGTTKAILGDHLRSGATVSCGHYGRRKRIIKKPKPPRPQVISTKALETRHTLSDRYFIKPHTYRQPVKIDMGPTVAAALAALAARRAA